jgi:hypothetical protein
VCGCVVCIIWQGVYSWCAEVLLAKQQHGSLGMGLVCRRLVSNRTHSGCRGAGCKGGGGGRKEEWWPSSRSGVYAGKCTCICCVV